MGLWVASHIWLPSSEMNIIIIILINIIIVMHLLQNAAVFDSIFDYITQDTCFVFMHMYWVYVYRIHALILLADVIWKWRNPGPDHNARRWILFSPRQCSRRWWPRIVAQHQSFSCFSEHLLLSVLDPSVGGFILIANCLLTNLVVIVSCFCGWFSLYV